MSKVGTIVVHEDGISVRLSDEEKGSWTSSEYEEATVENLRDAARILGGWMDLSFEDQANECRRIHNRDQFREFVREIISEASEGL